jgi:methyltransferase (TIGR00027 family)
VTSGVFSLLHLFDDSGIVDSSKNLRVLWARALLHHAGELEDPVARELLPKLTRDVVRWDALKPLARFAEFVTSRTRFIDGALDEFLDAAAPLGEPTQVVVVGAGFDTRAMRYARRATSERVSFFELDLPHVCSGKSGLWDAWAAGTDLVKPAYVPYDLNDAGIDGSSPVAALEAAGFDAAKPTLFVSEAVLFYVDDLPKRNLFEQLLLSRATHPDSALVLADNLKPLLISPFAHEARAFFDQSDHVLLKHSARWGGAVHYAFAAKRGSRLLPALEKTRDKVINSRVRRRRTSTSSREPEEESM